MREYVTSDETLAAIAERHGSTAARLRPLPRGVANRSFLLGDDLVLRIPRTEEFLADLVKEAAVIPVALRAGVRTPEIVTFDDSCSVVDVPYMILARAGGVDLAGLDLPATGTDRVLHQVGRELAKLHRLPGPAPAGVPVDDGDADPWAYTGRLARDGWIDREAARWLTACFDRLHAHLPQDSPRVLIHGDIAPQNLLVSPQAARLGGIVDWGDAAWADPAADFAKMPLTGIPAMLDGYRREGAAADAPAWEARVLWFHLTWALGRLPDPAPRPGERHWTAPPAGRILGLLRFFASAPPYPWNELITARGAGRPAAGRTGPESWAAGRPG